MRCPGSGLQLTPGRNLLPVGTRPCPVCRRAVAVDGYWIFTEHEK